MRFTRDGVLFTEGGSEEFDEVILATGYRAAIGMLGNLIQRDERGFAARDRVQCWASEVPELWNIALMHR